VNQYASIDRAPIKQAVVDRIRTWNATNHLFVSVGRRHIAPPQLLPAQQPACFVCGCAEIKKAGPRGLPGKLELVLFAFLYAYNAGQEQPIGDETVLAEDVIDRMLEAIDDALMPDEQGRQTLGGLVTHCWVEGADTPIEPGLFGQQAMAVVPIHVEVP
jgi:hypothetical protein